MIIFDMIGFIKTISYSETTHVSTKQGLAVIFTNFEFLSKKNATKVHKILFFVQYFVSFVANTSLG